MIYENNPYTKEGKTILFTVQDKRSLNIIEKDGVFYNKKEYIEAHLQDISPMFLRCYDWFKVEAQKRVPRPKDAQYHIWCSVSAKNCMRPCEGEIAYILEVPNDEIIYFSGVKWDYVLNLHYVPENDEDLAKYQREMKEKGFANCFEFIQGRYSRMFPNEEKRIIDSWKRVFDIDNWNIFEVQANIWRIKKEWIKAIVNPYESIPEKYILD